MAHGVVRLDKVKSQRVGHVYSVVYSAAAVDNGSFGFLGGLVSGERELKTLVQPTTALLPTESAVLISAPTINYEQAKATDNNPSNCYTAAGVPVRAYELNVSDVISVSKDMVTPISTAVVVGNYLVCQNGSFALKEVASLGTEKFAAKIIATETVGLTVATGQAGAVGGVINYVVLEVVKN